MSTQFYWYAKSTRSWGKRKDFPNTFYKTAGQASLECIQNEQNYPHHKWKVKRVLMETKDGVHYDIYEHEFKRINK